MSSKAASARLRKAGFRNLGVLSSEATCLLVFFGGRPSSRNSGKFHGFGSFQSGVHSVLVAGVTTGRAEAAAGAAGAGIGGQALASAGRCRHRQAEGWCSPTSAGVRRAPEPSLQCGCTVRNSSGPGRTPALSPPAGQLAPRVGGQRGTACQDRAQRHVSYIGLEPLPRGTTTWPRGQRRSALPAAALPRRSWVATAAAG